MFQLVRSSRVQSFTNARREGSRNSRHMVKNRTAQNANAVAFDDSTISLALHYSALPYRKYFHPEEAVTRLFTPLPAVMT